MQITSLFLHLFCCLAQGATSHETQHHQNIDESEKE